ncbi:MAG: serine hydrolase domain-containing protein [Bacteroidota bacterium]|nr:serine hydrolase domain-containing protein [Bacteroidota bacterium]
MRYILTIILILITSISNLSNSKNYNSTVKKNKIVSKKVSNENRKGSIEEKIDALLKRTNFNGTALVSIKGKVVYKSSNGYANFQKKEPLKLNSSFQLASVSKQFTAMSVMILMERKKIHFDDPVKKYLPDFPYPNITIKHLLNHTSGLQNYMWLLDYYWKNPKNPTNRDVLNLFKTRTLPLNFQPGKRFCYSNTGYSFLALIVEKVSGMPFADFVKKNIFIPLDMRNSFIYNRAKVDKNEKRVSGYYGSGRRARLVDDDKIDCILGDKGVYSTVEDLYKYDQALYNNKLVSKDTKEQSYNPGKLKNNQEIRYGYGWRLKEYKDKKVIYHNGQWHGFKTSFTRIVEDRNTIILLNNTNSKLAGIIQGIEDIIYGYR